MQYLKEDIKDAIIKSALNEFKEKNYIEASMRNIAKNAGMTVGNIYRYFESKDALFNFIMDPVWQDVTKVIFNNYGISANLFPITEIIASVMDIYKKFSVQLYILLYNSKGSKYQNVKEGLVDLIEKRIEKEMLPLMEANNKMIEDEFIFRIVSNAMVDSIYIIIKECGDNINRVEALIEQMITIFGKDLYNRL